MGPRDGWLTPCSTPRPSSGPGSWPLSSIKQKMQVQKPGDILSPFRIPKRNYSRLQEVGRLTREVIDLLGLKNLKPASILIGPTNISHMQSEHPDDFDQLFECLPIVISDPTYVGLHPNGKSIEYIRIFYERDGEIVLVAVRVSNQGTLFARSLYTITHQKLQSYLAAGTVKEYSKDATGGNRKF